MMKSYLLAALVVSLPGAGFGATIVQTQNFGFVPNGSQVLTFDKFDSQGGNRILESVTITVTLTKSGGRFEVDNDSATGGTINLTHSVTATLSSEDVALITNSFGQLFGSGVLAANSQLTEAVSATTTDPTNSFNATGEGDYVLFEPADATDTESRTVGSNFTSSYVGTGTFDAMIEAAQVVSATGLGGLQQAFTVSDVSGTVTLTYNYSGESPTVPEPATSLLGLFGAVLLMRRRQR